MMRLSVIVFLFAFLVGCGLAPSKEGCLKNNPEAVSKVYFIKGNTIQHQDNAKIYAQTKKCVELSDKRLIFTSGNADGYVDGVLCKNQSVVNIVGKTDPYMTLGLFIGTRDNRTVLPRREMVMRVLQMLVTNQCEVIPKDITVNILAHEKFMTPDSRRFIRSKNYPRES